MTNDEFIDVVRSTFYTELKKTNLLSGFKHLGKVNSVTSPYLLSVFVDGSTIAQNIPCNPNVRFYPGEEVWVEYINGNSADKFIPSKRATGSESTDNSYYNVVDFSIYATDSKNIIINVVDQNNIPLSLLGASITWALVDSNNIIILTKNIGSGITISNSTTGQFTVVLASTETTNLSGKYQHSARVTLSDSRSAIAFTGTITVSKGLL